MQEEYGIPNISFWVSRYTYLLRPYTINPTLVGLYDNFIVIQGLSKTWIIDSNNYIAFRRKNFNNPYTLMLKADNAQGYEEIKFSILSDKKARLIKRLLNTFN